jgi:integrase/recombinase XerD
MASIYKRGKYLWIAWYQEGKILRKSLKLIDTKENRRIAHQEKLKLELELSRKNFARQTNNIYFSDAVYSFLLKKNLLKDNKSVYKSAFKRFSEYLNTDPLLTQIKQEDLVLFSRWLSDQQNSEATIQTYLNHLNIFFNWCKSEGYINHNLQLKIKITKKTPRIIKDEHLHKLLWYLKVHSADQYNLIKFLVLTGFRKSEALSLTWNDIDFDRNIIYVNNTKAKRTEIFPIYETLKNFLKKIEKKNDRLFNYSKDGLDFYNRALKRLNLPQYSIHDLRRKFGTMMAEKGLTPYELQKLMRHQNIRTTMQYYINIDLQSIAKKM